MGFNSILPVFVALVIGSSFPTQSAAHDVPVCPETHTFKEQNGFCYFFSELIPLPDDEHNHTLTDADSWEDAKTRCESLKDTHSLVDVTIGLAEFGAPDNLKSDKWLMQQIVTQNHPVWLGAKKVQSGAWKWSTKNRDLSFWDAYWGPSQPDNFAEGHKCLSTMQDGDTLKLKTGDEVQRQYFNDENCDKALPYVCQFKLVAANNPSGGGVEW